ncbi:MAG: DUF1887 family protein, partial [Clostridia bacterium]|nr:DUF1887 family protein [Clostridia bacterium]
MKTLIELYDTRPIHNVLATEVFRPSLTVMLCPDSVGEKVQRQIRKYFTKRGISSSICFCATDLLDANAVADSLRKALDAYEDCAVDIAGGTDAALFAAGAVCAQRDVPAFTYSRKQNTFFEIRNAPYAEALSCNVRLKVEDTFLMAGGEMLPGRMDNDTLSVIEDRINPLFSLYQRFRKIWQQQITYIQSISQNQKDEISSPRSLSMRRGTLLRCEPAFFASLEKIGMIHQLRMTDDEIRFFFTDEISRFVLRDIGSVLELYVWKACKDAKVFDDIRLSAIVNWEGGKVKAQSVTNEIDVVCTRGVTPLFISCKTCAIKTDALNELAILRDRFGAPTAKAL